MLSDHDFMHLFGITMYDSASLPLTMQRSHIVFANDHAWTHIADDYFYSLWHNPQIANAIATLSTQYDVFWSMIGDSDDSFAFESYQGGTLVRKYVYERDTVTEGDRLRGEPPTLHYLKAAADTMFPTITQALEIVRITDPLQCRYYTYDRK